MNKQVFFSVIALVFACIANAQDFQGKAIYFSKSTMPEFRGPKDMPESRRKEIMERMKKMSEKTFTLTFNKSEALYIKEEKLEAPSVGGGGGRGGRIRFGSTGDGKFYKNIGDQSYTEESEMFGKVFLIKDKLPTFNWVMGTETKKIGNYTAYKATAIQPKDSLSLESLMRKREKEREAERNKKDGDKEDGKSMFGETAEAKETVITAWFTPEIPVSNGPGNYWGLPGLILEVNTDTTVLLCTEIVLNADEKEEISAPKKGKEINQQDYDTLMMKKMEEMRERFRGGGNRGGGGGRRN